MSLEGKILGFAFGFGGQPPLVAGTYVVRTANQPSGEVPLTFPLGLEAPDYPRFNPNFGFETFGDEFEGYPGSTDWEIKGNETKLPFNVDIDWIEEDGKEFGLVNIRWINNDNSVLTTEQLDSIYDLADSNGDPLVNTLGLALFDVPNDASGLRPIESATWLTSFSDPPPFLSTLGPNVLPVVQFEAPFKTSLASGSDVVVINLIGRKGEEGNAGFGVTSFDLGAQIFKITLEPGGDLAIEKPPLEPEGIAGVPGLTTESSIFEQETKIFTRRLRSRGFGRFGKSNGLQWKGKNEESSFVAYKHYGNAS
ncbi:hypothetical protein MITS9509_03471 [Synechococcus sp. MIT S9509]|uniref:hypothetical protein n=1 Tax=Synechococcus sp. MIT S9509 TaxID=1801630 RepID=UPI0007BC357E|nr:hypothetical protein [Synechococcus sp. MIT S9509]KZR86500.1 hypothetical protein MITS9509_03471 [Synechococcus sp. MIT S9509]